MNLLTRSFIGTLAILIGFVTGAVIDNIFYKIYLTMDPEEKDMAIFLAIVLPQLYMIVFIDHLIKTQHKYSSVNGYLFTIGLFTSQIFLVKFAANKINKHIFNRENKELCTVTL